MPEKVKLILPQQVTPIEVDTACIVTIDGQAILLMQTDIAVPDNGIEFVTAVCLTPAQAQSLRNSGIGDCEILNEIPATMPGRTVTLRGILCIGDQAFIVFEAESSGMPPTEELLLVQTSSIPVICDSVPIAV
ncbi:MAG: hypothetical protein ACOX8W_03010 [bacterium]|jgi:hypothetical protein